MAGTVTEDHDTLSPVRPHTLLSQTATRFNQPAARQGVLLTAIHGPDTPQMVVTDVRALRQALDTLVRGVLAASDGGRVSLRTFADGGDGWGVRVVGTGCTVAPDATTARQLIARLGGTLTVTRAPDAGIAFVVLLPNTTPIH